MLRRWAPMRNDARRTGLPAIDGERPLWWPSWAAPTCSAQPTWSAQPTCSALLVAPESPWSRQFEGRRAVHRRPLPRVARWAPRNRRLWEFLETRPGCRRGTWLRRRRAQRRSRDPFAADHATVAFPTARAWAPMARRPTMPSRTREVIHAEQTLAESGCLEGLEAALGPRPRGPGRPMRVQGSQLHCPADESSRHVIWGHARRSSAWFMFGD